MRDMSISFQLSGPEQFCSCSFHMYDKSYMKKNRTQ